jgi:ribosomal protein S6
MNFYEHTLIAKQDLSTLELDSVEKKYSDIITKTEGLYTLQISSRKKNIR